MTNGKWTNCYAREVSWGVKHIIIGTILVMVALFTAAAAALVSRELYATQEDALAT